MPRQEGKGRFVNPGTSIVKALMLAAVIVIAANNGFAQTAEITGRITDATGAVVADASLTVTNVGTGAQRAVSSNSDGYYTVPLLLPGQYTIAVQRAGFKNVLRSGVVLAVDQRAELDFTLEVGSISDRIEVQAAAPQLNTVDASQGQVIENRRIVELPLNGRTYDDLALLSAGATQPLGNARFSGFSSGGMRDTQNNFILDGVDNNRWNSPERNAARKWYSHPSMAFKSLRFRPMPMRPSMGGRWAAL
jgi:hypothetical protein